MFLLYSALCWNRYTITSFSYGLLKIFSLIPRDYSETLLHLNRNIYFFRNILQVCTIFLYVFLSEQSYVVFSLFAKCK